MLVRGHSVGPALGAALRGMPDAALGYTDPHGAFVLRQALADYLSRVRGVDACHSRGQT